MTYNIHRAIGVDRRFRPERIASIASHHDPDVLLLQEVDDNAPRSNRLDLARALADTLGYAYYEVGHNVRLRQGRYGNATLSRYPIVDARNIDLTIDRLKRRGCQFTRIAVPGQNSDDPALLPVFNLHLGLLAQERARQIGRLACAPEFAELAAGAPCVIGGDFNDWRMLLHPIFLDILGFSNATQASRPSYKGGLRTYPSFSPSGSLDRIYYRNVGLRSARTCRLAASKVASDHLPVVGDFVL